MPVCNQLFYLYPSENKSDSEEEDDEDEDNEKAVLKTAEIYHAGAVNRVRVSRYQ